jgi:hypothetical protein
MNGESLKDVIKRELPGLLREDPALRDYILELARHEFAGRTETQDRFYEILAELRRDREEQSRQWEEQNRKWDEQSRQWGEQNRKWDEQSRQWGEQNRKWDEQNRKWDEQNRLWREQWEAHQQQHKEEFDRRHEEIMAIAGKLDRHIGALGARWGLQSETAFRNALAGILEQSFAVEVRRVSEYDDQGVVFGRPDQVELDVIIKDGLLLICELKSSMDKAAMYAFERKARFYEKRHDRKADRLIVISPMIDAKAQEVAEKLGIETYSDSDEVKAL